MNENYEQLGKQDVKRFMTEIQTFIKLFNDEGPFSPDLTTHEIFEKMRIFQSQFNNFQKILNTYKNYQIIKIPEFDDLEQKMQQLNQLYELYNELNEYIVSIRDILWKDVYIKDIESHISEFQQRITQFPSILKNLHAYIDIQLMIDDFMNKIPLFESLSDPSIQECQWEEVIYLTGCNFDEPEKLLFGQIFDSCIFDYKDDILEICKSARVKQLIFSGLKEIKEEWKTTEFPFTSYKSEEDIILKSYETSEIKTKIEDSLICLSCLQSNKYIGHLKKEVSFWMKKLEITNLVLSEWMKVQSLWIDLENVFSLNKIVLKMKEEANNFTRISKNLLKMIKIAKETKNIVKFCYETDGLHLFFKHIYDQLHKYKNILSIYLEKMRNSFPRFYFISDDTLTDILSHMSNPQSIQSYLQYIFENIVHLGFDNFIFNKVIEFRSSEGEIVHFSKPFYVQEDVEIWLNDVVLFIKETLRDLISENINKIMKFKTEQWLNERIPAQVSDLSMMIWFTYRTEDSLRKASKTKNKKIINETLHEFELIFKELIQISRSIDQENKLKSVRAESLINSFLHCLDIYRQLIQSGVTSPDHIDWLKQIRYYWQQEDRKCVVSIGTLEREYSYEYHGLSSRLIANKFTDDYYFSISNELNSFRGCLMSGPAGTGKAETIKDLAKAFGILCVIFNCYDQMNCMILNNFLKGLSQAGVWGDFDELNRINVDVLSVFSQQVSCISDACREKVKHFKFTDGSTLKLDDRVGIFVSISPFNQKHEEFSEKLRNQFRAINMEVPDKRSFIRFILANCGFSLYDELSYNFDLFYQNCSERLSKQVHYDWGFRNILSVYKCLKKTCGTDQLQDEKQILKKTIENINICKIVDEDKKLFLDLLNDTFKSE